MKQINKKIQQFTSPGTKKSYENTIKYLLSIVKYLLKQGQTQNTKNKCGKQLSQSKYSRAYSLRSNKQDCQAVKVKNQQFDQDESEYQQSQQELNTQSFKGSQISFIQNINNNYLLKQQIKQQMKKKSTQSKREFQKIIQIYHQCLNKAIQTIKQQHVKLVQNLKIEQHHINKLDQFWQKYQKQKKQCKKFSQLIKISHGILAKQFLTVLFPIKQFINPKKFRQRPQSYILYVE